MKIIKLKRGEEAIVDDDIYEKFGDLKWHCNNGYAITCNKCLTNNFERKRISLHRVVMDVHDKDVLVDHIDRNPLNNLRNNLRLCTKVENGQNRKKQINNTSGFIGVSRVCQSKKLKSGIEKKNYYWQAQIRKRDIIMTKVFKYKFDAIKYYDDGVKILYGVGHTNF